MVNKTIAGLVFGFLVACWGPVQAQEDLCDGHGITKEHAVKAGDESPIQVAVTADGQSVEAGYPLDLGFRPVGAVVKFHVGASDIDVDVCEVPAKEVKNYILDVAEAEKEVPDPANPGQTKKVKEKAPVGVSIFLKGQAGNPDIPLATVPLATAPADPPLTDRSWDASWPIPASVILPGQTHATSLVGWQLVFRFFGVVDDFPCSAPNHKGSDDEAVCLEYRGYSAELTVSGFKVDMAVDSNADGKIDPTPGGADDDIETANPGMLLCINSDDDNSNGLEDLTDPGDSSEDNLQPMKLAFFSPSLNGGSLELSIQAGGDRVKVWTSPRKGTGNEVIFTNGRKEYTDLAEFPSVLYVEGISAGRVGFKLSYRVNSSDVDSDRVVVTVVPDKLMGCVEAAFPEQ